jgi:RNA polymerase sigma-70 factor (ECF subfamily)
MPSYKVVTPWDDETLVAGLKRREPQAVEHAVVTYAPKLYRYALYQLQNSMAAEDLVSDVITRMLEKIDGYEYTGVPFQSWLFRIARNLVTDIYRKRRTPVLSLESWQEEHELQEVGALDPRLEQLLDRDRLQVALAQLTPEQRQVLTLRVVEGWQPADIAVMLDRSIDSVKSLQYRALQALRRVVAQTWAAADDERGASL